jgi:hypothetical protein
MLGLGFVHSESQLLLAFAACACMQIWSARMQCTQWEESVAKSALHVVDTCKLTAVARNPNLETCCQLERPHGWPQMLLILPFGSSLSRTCAELHDKFLCNAMEEFVFPHLRPSAFYAAVWYLSARHSDFVS